jgi:hypothetical protein
MIARSANVTIPNVIPVRAFLSYGFSFFALLPIVMASIANGMEARSKNGITRQISPISPRMNAVFPLSCPFSLAG